MDTTKKKPRVDTRTGHRGTKHRTIRIPDNEWRAAIAAGNKADVAISDVLREALRAFIASQGITIEQEDTTP